MDIDKERAEFEVWAQTCDGNCNDTDLRKFPDTDRQRTEDGVTYVNQLVERDWQVWQARAALASQDTAPPDGDWQAMRDEVLHGIDGLDNDQTNAVLNVIDNHWPAAAPAQAVDAALSELLDEAEANGNSKEWCEEKGRIIRAALAAQPAAPKLSPDAGDLRKQWAAVDAEIGGKAMHVAAFDDGANCAKTAAPAYRYIRPDELKIMGRHHDGSKPDIELPIFGDGSSDGKRMFLVALPKPVEPAGEPVALVNAVRSDIIGFLRASNDEDCANRVEEFMTAEAIMRNIAAAPVANAGQAQAVAVPWTDDAEKWGSALNDASWTFIETCQEKSALLFNTCKTALRAAILKYAERVAAAPLPQQVAQTEAKPFPTSRGTYGKMTPEQKQRLDADLDQLGQRIDEHRRSRDRRTHSEVVEFDRRRKDRRQRSED